MAKYEFRLAPGYCLENGISVWKQNGSYISFLIGNIDNELMKNKLRNAFCTYLGFVRKQDDCGSNYMGTPKIEFIGASKRDVVKNIVERVGMN